ncbi:MAG: helix-turn-helix domain-containing protein [Thermoguttaceae bacterium]
MSQRFTCRRIELRLEPQPYSPELVKATRNALGVSQALFAKFLGASVKTVSAWERGAKVPRDVACRFMDEIRRDPKYWQGRLRELAVVKGGGEPAVSG